MILHGNNLVIIANGEAIAAAKSCTLNIKTEKIHVSSPTDGNWKHYIAGIKEWSVETSTLMKAYGAVTDKITAFATHHDGVQPNYLTTPPYIELNGNKVNPQGLLVERGLTVIAFNPTNMQVVTFGTFDTYSDINGASTSLWNMIYQNMGCIFACYSYDAFGISTLLAETLPQALGLPALPSYVSGQKGRWAYAFVTGPKSQYDGTYKGISMFAAHQTTARALLNLTAGYPSADTPMKTAYGMVGSNFTIKCQVEGFAYDILVGEAICETFCVTASESNLMQGNFYWQGNGPLT